MSNYIGSLPESAKDIQAQLPIGAIIAFSNAKLPLGWIECNGQATTAYPLLAAVAGANVPDLRGEFIRGFDNGKGTDTGRVLGSSQADEFKSHRHTYSESYITDAIKYTAGSVWGGNNPSAQSGLTGGVETRPKNVALIYIIKAFNIVSNGEVSGFITANKNYIINPTFSINQRGYAGGAIGYALYGYDRWQASTAITTLVLSGTTVTIPSGERIQQPIEYNSGLQGQVMTLSWEGTAEASLWLANGSTLIRGASPISFTVTGSGNYLDYAIFEAGTLKNPKLELGSTPTPFEYPDKGSELTKCQRYFEKTYLDSIAPGTISTPGSMYEPATRNAAVLSGGIFFKVTKRAVPVVTLYSNQTGASGVVNNVTDKAAVMNQISENGARYLTITGGVTTTSVTYQWTASAEL